MRLLLVDANNLFCRAWFAAPMGQKELRTEQYFKKSIAAAKRELLIDVTIVVWDGGRDAERMEIFPTYKAGRPDKPAQFFELMTEVEKAVIATGLYENVRIDGVEADDAIATIAHYHDCPDHTIFISTNDKDLLQLVGKNIVVHHPAKGNIDGIIFKRDFGFDAHFLADYLAIMGDSSDNIPGAKGIGEQGAKFLIQKYGSIESIYDNINDVEAKYKKKLLASKDMVFVSKRLTKLRFDIQVDLPWLVF